MAAPRDKKKVDIRELMKQQKAAKQSSSKKIDSPLARYNNLGQLMCKVCNQQVKSEILWPAHVQGKKHKDNVVLLKTGKAPTRKDFSLKSQSSSEAPVKRKAEPPVAAHPIKGILKKPRIGLPYGDSSSEDSESDTETPQNNLPADFFDNGKGAKQTSSSSGSAKVTKVNSNPSSSQPSGLPADFFDTGMSTPLSQLPGSSSRNEPESASEEKPSTEQSDKPMSEVLPEGFFDDPVKDAKARHVEVKNTMEEEWEKFQKEMETQQKVSETLAEEDDEAAQTERNIDEIDEQIQCFAKVETLWNKQDELKSKPENERRHEDENAREEGDSGDEAEFEEFLNWRSKGAYK